MADDREKVTHSDLALDDLRENPPGRDDRHLEDEYVTFENDGDSVLDVSGWTVANEAGDEFTFPDGTALEPGGRVTVHSGQTAESGFAWGSDRPVWRNAGDTVFVRDGDDVLRLRESYNE